MTWPTIPLRRLAVCLDGQRIPLNREQRAEMQGDVPYWGAGGVMDSVNKAIFNEPLVLLGEDGAPFFTPGKDVAYFIKGPSWINNHIHALRPMSCDARFLTYALNSVDYTNYITGATRDKLTQDDLKQIEVPNPPPEEQRRIADFLDAETARIDQLCARRHSQISLLNERLHSIWADVIMSDGDQSAWVPIRRFITAITDGPFGSALTSSHYSDSGARVIRLGNLGRAEFRATDAAYIPLEYFSELKRHEARPGDLIVAGLGDQNHPLGRACIVPDGLGPAIVKADCFRLRLDQSSILHEYAAWALSSPVVADQVTSLARGSTRARINLEVVREITIPSPSMKRQIDSVRTLHRTRTASEAVATRCRQQLDLLTERRQALITAAVTGQFDVSTASGRNVTDGVTA
ncbi:restriction endonuclease subunit S [Streptomyces anandii]|uniref:restriction endonuclease subunit S n=1 Tax=Streptomyces anandii TaxID=285454 RepID=UPI0036A6BEEE